MSQSLSKVSVHLVFSTKGRAPFLKDCNLRQECYAYMASLLRDSLDSPAMTIGGVEDHVHVLFVQSRRFSLMDIVKSVKTESCKWIKRQNRIPPTFAWQAGYGAFSVSESVVPKVQSYIENQEAHHKRMSFQDELREICRRYKVPLNEQYAWN